MLPFIFRAVPKETICPATVQEMKKVIGIGNALTDVLVNLPTDDVLHNFGLPKGSMSLVDTDLQYKISESTAGMPRTMSLGGSAGNTIRALAKLGTQTGFIGKVGQDETGDFLIAALDNLGIRPAIFRGGNPSGVCISLVSRDGERTMATHLGAALELEPGEIKKEMFDGYDCLYVEGYLVQNHDLIERAVSEAKKKGLKVAIDLASYNVVADNLAFLRDLTDAYIDIVFANEQEAHAFTGETNPVKALDRMAGMADLAVVKVGREGAYIRQGREFLHVGIMSEARRVDTTGAGDLYAAGFLAGICEGLPLRKCGTLGSIAAGKVIEVVGTTFGEDVWSDISRLANNVRTDRYLF